MKLYLEDGSSFSGESVGARRSVSGELVFTTGMVGYPETLTDPSYRGQIVVFTYPLIGNYGVPKQSLLESAHVQAAGVVINNYHPSYQHQSAVTSLEEWLTEAGVPLISGVDTREVTKLIRTKGALLGALSFDTQFDTKAPNAFADPNLRDLVAEVSPRKRVEYGDGKRTVLLIDCGMKRAILESLLARGVRVVRVPHDHDVSQEEFDGVVLSNGPGDPTRCHATIKSIQHLMTRQKPILGICLGNQLLALAAGASTYKLPFGHRSQNQPCLNRQEQQRCYITSQNHGFAVDASTLPQGWEVWFENANDKSVEGIRHQSLPWRSVQFHPEATPGPTDCGWIFDDFVREL